MSHHIRPTVLASEFDSWPWPFSKLSVQQKRVALLMLEGVRYKEIAERFGCSVKTIDAHRAEVYVRTGVSSQVQLGYLAIGVGLIEVPVVSNTAPPVPAPAISVTYSASDSPASVTYSAAAPEPVLENDQELVDDGFSADASAEEAENDWLMDGANGWLGEQFTDDGLF